MIQKTFTDSDIAISSYPSEVIPLPFTLPGKGQRSPGCGDSIPFHCNRCDTHFIVESSCMLRTCPSCFRKWAVKEGRKAAKRIWAASSIIAPKRTGRRLVHAVVSFHAQDDIQDLRKRAIKVCKDHGISGGALVFHPFRSDDDEGYIPDGYIHFHVIGLARGNIKPGTDPNVIFKIIKDARRKDYRGFQKCQEISATIFYLLTHCGIIKGRHALAYFGELSYNKLSNGKLQELIPGLDLDPVHKHRCPSCRSDDVEPDYYLDYTAWSTPYYVDNRRSVIT